MMLAVGYLLTFLQPKAKIYFWSPHYFIFNLEKEGVVIQTDAITVQNTGRKSAENVEIIMEKEPDFFQLAPTIPYSTQIQEDGNFVLRIESLGPKEFFTFQLLSYKTTPKLLNIRSSSGAGQPMPFQIARAFPKWFYALTGFLLLVGLGFTTYWIIKAIIFVSLNQ